MTGAGARSSGPDRLLLVALFVAVFMSALDTAVVAPAIPALRQAFSVDHRQISFVTTVFVLTSMPSTALMGNLADRIGRRPVFLWCVAGFALGSLCIAASGSFAALLAGRALQGLGAGGILPATSAIIGDAFPAPQRGRALGMIGATYGLAFVVGPPLATLLMLSAGWRWIFLLNLPIAAAVLVLGARSLPAPAPAAAQPWDARGMLLLFLLLASLVFGITGTLDELAGLPVSIALLALCAVLLLVFLRVERAAPRPTVPLSLFQNRELRLAYLLTSGTGFGMGAVAFLTSIATLAHGVEPARAGFSLLPLVLCSMAASVLAGRKLHALGSRRLVIAGFALLAAGYAGCAILGLGITGFLVASAPVGMGIGILAGGALRTIAIDEAPAELRGSAQGLINLSNGIGTLLSVAFIGTVADARGGGSEGFALAYAAVALVMVAGFLVALRLARRVAAPN